MAVSIFLFSSLVCFSFNDFFFLGGGEGEVEGREEGFRCGFVGLFFWSFLLRFPLPLSSSLFPSPSLFLSFSLSLWLARHPARLFSLAWPRVFVCSHRRAARAFALVPARLCLRVRVLTASAVARTSVASPCNFPRL